MVRAAASIIVDISYIAAQSIYIYLYTLEVSLEVRAIYNIRVQ